MKDNKNNKGSGKNNNNDKDRRGVYSALYVTAAAFLLLCFGISMANSKQIAEKNEVRKTTETTTSSGAALYSDSGYRAVEKSNVKSYTEQTTAAVRESSIETTVQQTTAADTAAYDAAAENPEPVYSLFDASKEMVWPVSGPIVMDYSVETGIFDKTLQQYRTNDNICISADVGTQVAAAADGVVTSIFSDPVGGVTVCLDNGNGWSTTYSQLRNNVPLAEGQVVYAGDVIGQIAEPTKYSVELGPHLQFSVCEENKSVDPKTVLEQIDE